jgi:hypothetical protein
MVRMFVIALNGYYALTTVLGHKENTFIWVQRVRVRVRRFSGLRWIIEQPRKAD